MAIVERNAAKGQFRQAPFGFLENTVRSVNLQILTDKAVESTGDLCILMCDQPLVNGGKKLILTLRAMGGAKIRVGSLGKNNDTAERLIIYAAGCVMKRGGIDLDGTAGRKKKRLDLGCVIMKIIRNILLFAQKKDQIVFCDIDLRRAMILQRIQIFVVTIAVANLDRQFAIHDPLHLTTSLCLFQSRIRCDIDRMICRALGLF